MSRLTLDETAEPVSRDQILRRERRQGNVHFPCLPYHEQDCRPYPAPNGLYSGIYIPGICYNNRTTYVYHILTNLYNQKGKKTDPCDASRSCFSPVIPLHVPLLRSRQSSHKEFFMLRPATVWITFFYASFTCWVSLNNVKSMHPTFAFQYH